MKSVQVFPRMQRERVKALLNSVGERSGSEWFGIADRRLEASMKYYESDAELIQALTDEASFSSSDLNAVRRVSNELSGVWVEVRVSGRGDFQAEMRQLVDRLLTEGGYALDDYSLGVWSLAEIRHGRRDGQPFRA
ncbi:hypothetical protein [Kribbella sp. CA-293567]|uniref:hypothetical protein n=1 Tax=Kribbella sp. CA-293567 TaxID=3002436 RepID=UPI0022DE03EC|nr:hypothetical protein [Kribbella sp. CA-293567]WBQ05972.1 hypothetical protein OX958_04020 [Kribbella sp. CA-293567]